MRPPSPMSLTAHTERPTNGTHCVRNIAHRRVLSRRHSRVEGTDGPTRTRPPVAPRPRPSRRWQWILDARGILYYSRPVPNMPGFTETVYLLGAPDTRAGIPMVVSRWCGGGRNVARIVARRIRPLAQSILLAYHSTSVSAGNPLIIWSVGVCVALGAVASLAWLRVRTSIEEPSVIAVWTPFFTRIVYCLTTYVRAQCCTVYRAGGGGGGMAHAPWRFMRYTARTTFYRSQYHCGFPTSP